MKRHVYLLYRIIFLVATGVNITPEYIRILSAINCCCAAARLGFRTFCFVSRGYKVPGIFFDARLVRSNRLVKSNKMQQNVAKPGWGLTKVTRIGRSRSVYGQKRVEGGVGQLREPKLSVCCLHVSLHPFLAKNRSGAPVFGYCPKINIQRVILYEK